MLYTNLDISGKRRAHLVIALAIVLIFAVRSTAHAQSDCRLNLNIAMNAADLTAAQVNLLQDQVDRIWNPYLVDVQWTVAPMVSGMADRLTLSVIDAPGPVGWARTDQLPVAWIPFVGSTPIPVFTASTRAAQRVVEVGLRERRWPVRADSALLMAQTLGRAIAHELGHYLLASKTHSQLGLMRASMSVGEFVDRDLRSFQLDRAQAALIRERVLARCASAGSTPGR